VASLCQSDEVNNSAGQLNVEVHSSAKSKMETTSLILNNQFYNQ